MSERTMRWRDLETWYRVVGDLAPGTGRTPVVILHGGPGASHDYCEPIAELSRFGHACVLYDSTPRPVRTTTSTPASRSRLPTAGWANSSLLATWRPERCPQRASRGR
jgi:hypothetical protein